MRKLTLKNLTSGMCRWPIGDPRQEGFHFCGAAVDADLPYCREHADRAHQSASSGRAAARKKDKAA